MEGQGLRDSAHSFAELDCVVLGASFDAPADNLAFARDQEFPFDLLSDVDRSVGAAYDVVRSGDPAYAAFPERFTYLIDPEGVIRRSYAVTDVIGHAEQVLTDLRGLVAHG